MIFIIYKIINRINIYIENIKKHYYHKLFNVKKIDLYFPLYISHPQNINVGENVALGTCVNILAIEKITIGENTMIGAQTIITTSTHDYNKKIMRSSRIDKPIYIGKNVWIGAGSIILPGITIGDNSVVGAGAIVTKNVPENVIVAGIPATIIKKKAI